jgi:UDP-N-acetylmuramoylalanine--D-glutamate ligase
VITRPPLPPGPFLVVGLARSGLAAAELLAGQGARVVGTDAKPVEPEVKRRLEGMGVEMRDGDQNPESLEGIGTVVKSPGVPREARLIAAALQQKITVMGEVELGWRLLPNEFIGLTGSNGKTTTVELIGHIHRQANAPVFVAGNVGTALTSLPGHVDPDATIVCELSSFQLEDTLAFAPEAAVLLNLAEDHLDRHGTFDAYRAAKLNVFAHQPAGTLAVVPADLSLDDAGGEAERVTFGAHADMTHRDGTLYWQRQPLIHTNEISLRGAHNRENAMAAAAVTLARGLPKQAVIEGLKTFRGVPHRLEEIATIDGVTYVNDSKATNVASAEVGIRSFTDNVHLIAGGSEKHSDYTPLAEPVTNHCRAVYLIGETAPGLRAALTPTNVPLYDAHDLARAVAQAHERARPGDVVLLSPACASYDQYRSYEHRGEHFRQLVQELEKA